MKWILAVLLLGVGTVFANTREIEGEILARAPDSTGERWAQVSVTLYINTKGDVYIQAGEGRLAARGFIPSGQVPELIALTKKGSEWAEKAREAKLEASKPLGQIVWKGEHEHGVWLTFFSANEGRQTDVIMRVVDFDNRFRTREIYLDRSGVAVLAVLLEKVPKALEELKEQVKKADILN